MTEIETTEDGESKFSFTDETGCRLLVMHDDAGLTISVSKGDDKMPHAIAYLDEDDAYTLLEALEKMLGLVD